MNDSLAEQSFQEIHDESVSVVDNEEGDSALAMTGELYAVLDRAAAKMRLELERENNERFLRRAKVLYSTFGEVVRKGLALYESGSVVRVHVENDARPFVFEVQGPQKSHAQYLHSRVFTIYPDVNYCRCETFQTSGSVESKKEKKGTIVMPHSSRRVLCVAEKNDAAKNIAAILSKGQSVRRPGRSRFNQLYCFDLNQCLGRPANIVFTSVSGHLLSFEFGVEHRNWDKNTIETLFGARVYANVVPDMKDIEMTLREQSRQAQILIIWTDCDREGENIGGEVAGICLHNNPRIDVYRARFSEITPRAIFAAMQNLKRIDQRVVDAVDCRSELDLRIGAAFTRLQTLYLRTGFANILPDKVISYGSCQFPTLGFVVERYKAINEFVPEQFWQLIGRDMSIVGTSPAFVWQRARLFDRQTVEAFLDLCTEASGSAVVVDVDKHPKSKWRPTALETVELEKCGIRFLRMTAKRVMMAAEKLYNNGFISYPRTETNKFPKNLNLDELVNMQCNSTQWGDFATEIISRGGANPRNGSKSDEAHPPIHPLKFATKDQITTADEWSVYEFVVRNFLACVSMDAKGEETKVKVKIGGETFTATGLAIHEMGYLRVYPYDKWADKSIPVYALHQRLADFCVTMTQGQTSPPQLLSEADLIALMDKYGIGTDATHAEHIEKIKQRSYVALNRENRFVPSFLGLALVDAYNRIGYEMSKPNLRANLEAQLVDICNGIRIKDDVLAEQIGKYKRIFQRTEDQIHMFSEVFRQYLNSRANGANNNNGNAR